MPRKKKDLIPSEEYHQFIKGLEIVNVVLASAELKRLALPQDAKLGFDAEASEIQTTRVQDGFGCQMPLQFKLYEESLDGQKTVFAEIHVTFEAWYRAEVAPSDQMLEAFTQVNLRMNLWPYVREFVHSQTQLMGLPPLVIPHLKN